MQQRGLTPTMIEHVIKEGKMYSGNKIGRFEFHDKINNVKVITEGKNKVITVIFGGVK